MKMPEGYVTIERSHCCCDTNCKWNEWSLKVMPILKEIAEALNGLSPSGSECMNTEWIKAYNAIEKFKEWK